MEVKLCYNASENNAIGKTIRVVETVSCTIKGDMSITEPVIILATNSSTMDSVNYAIIDTFDRCYFIDKITPMTGGRYEVKCNVDVLESFKDDILRLNCVIDKQENPSVGNLMYDDGSYDSLVKTYTETKQFSGSLPSEGEYILVVAG